MIGILTVELSNTILLPIFNDKNLSLKIDGVP
jgi:hypothetical protein